MTGQPGSTWPEVINTFEDFLRGAGLVCQSREEMPDLGTKLLQYDDADIGVRIVFDRGLWLVEVADTRFRPHEWYDAATVLDFLSGQYEDVLPLARQLEIMRSNWRAIVRAFEPIRRADTHMRMAFVRWERAKSR